MTVLTFEEALVAPSTVVGKKAQHLARLLALGEHVPRGVVISSDEAAKFSGQTRRRERVDSAGSPEDICRRTVAIYALEHASYLVLDRLVDDIEVKAAGLIEAPVAVRSSSDLEDGSSGSAAGQYDSFLDVLGRAALKRAIASCWASEWTARSQLYRQLLRQPAAVGGMAVIVQAMVAASAAGVVFSRDSTASRDLILIEAVRGLGDSLVSGRATPELVRVHRATLHVVEHQLVPGLDAPILTEAAIAAIAEAAIRIEGYFEAPQDIEWALDHRGLHILQSRPLTGPKPVISRPAEAEP